MVFVCKEDEERRRRRRRKRWRSRREELENQGVRVYLIPRTRHRAWAAVRRVVWRPARSSPTTTMRRRRSGGGEAYLLSLWLRQQRRRRQGVGNLIPPCQNLHSQRPLARPLCMVRYVGNYFTDYTRNSGILNYTVGKLKWLLISALKGYTGQGITWAKELDFEFQSFNKRALISTKVNLLYIALGHIQFCNSMECDFTGRLQLFTNDMW